MTQSTDIPTVANLAFVEALYDQYLGDPSTVGPEWRDYFDASETPHGPGLGPAFQARSIFAPAGPSNGGGVAPPAPLATRPAAPLTAGAADPGRLQALSQMSLFQGLSPEGLQEIAAMTRDRHAPAGEVILRKGEHGDGAYFVVRGIVRVERDGQLIATLGPGEVVGELSFLHTQVRSADVIAETDLELLYLGAAEMDHVLNTRSRVTRRLFETVAERLRSANMLQKRVAHLIRLYRVRGHRIADLDPLGRRPRTHPELELAYHGLSEGDLDVPVFVGSLHDPEIITLRGVIERMTNTYCRHIGVQFMHINDVDVQQWLQERMESSENRCELSRDEQLRILRKLTEAELFEQFIHAKYLGAKRFSLEGAESLLPLLDIAIEEAARHGVKHLLMGMAHRGRLNVLANILGKSPHQIFTEFEDADADRFIGRGDVKYHMGFSSMRTSEAGHDVHLSLTFNPSHLAFATPVVQGRVRGKQDRYGDVHREKVMGVVIHGDAAFAGQGVIQESLNMSELTGYRSGGTLHIIVNNQVGFTTDPEDSRSTSYATDVAKLLEIPIFHVNGEHPDAVAQAIKLAMEFRSRWKRDAVIDMYCYRRYGHNEGDEPRYTQPLMYQWIDRQPTVRENFVANMVALGVLTQGDADEIADSCRARLEQDLETARRGEQIPSPGSTPNQGVWSDYHGGKEADAKRLPTAVPATRLAHDLAKLTDVPDDIQLNSKLRRLMKKRGTMATGETPLDWWAGEALAFSTLLTEGHRIRLSGQDAQRGTFSHRHSVLHDQETGETWVPLRGIDEEQAPFNVWNSPLSEAAVLGFDYGYSLEWPEGLVIWEAQFGDFANAAQVIIDQFITTSEDKWSRLSGLVLLLPHGFEGQGPEHSSARLERYLTLAADDNISVMNLTTPAQFFHALRRQLVDAYRKPLVVMTPKSLLRHPRAVSPLADLAEGAFQKVIPDPEVAADGAAPHVILCSGKVYYDLLAAREERGDTSIPIVRVELLYPFPESELAELLSGCEDGTEIRWVQEEPSNMGAWRYLRAQTWVGVLGRMKLVSVTRPESAAPATGSGASHKVEQARLVEAALEI